MGIYSVRLVDFQGVSEALQGFKDVFGGFRGFQGVLKSSEGFSGGFRSVSWSMHFGRSQRCFKGPKDSPRESPMGASGSLNGVLGDFQGVSGAFQVV